MHDAHLDELVQQRLDLGILTDNLPVKAFAGLSGHSAEQDE